jgi:ATP-dependent Clp protease protease subunit
MAAETWLDASEAVAKGFADSVATNDKGAKAKNAWNLSAYANAPKAAEPEQIENCITEEHRARQQQRLTMLARLQVS